MTLPPGLLRQLDLAICTPNDPLQAVCSNEQWQDVHDQMAALIDAFQHIQRVRLEQQVKSGAGTASNRVDPDDLHELDRLILKESLKQVGILQRRLVREYAPA